MRLRPFSALEDIELVEPSINLQELLIYNNNQARKQCFQKLNIRQLINILRLVSETDEENLENFKNVSIDKQYIWIDAVSAINNFECVQLVDYNMKKFGFGEISIESDEYDFLLEYLIDFQTDETNSFLKICFPLIEIKTRKFAKISEVIENHCKHLKTSNDILSIIKNSKNLILKLKVLIIEDYENFDLVLKLDYETLYIVGNNIDELTIIRLIEKPESLKNIYFVGCLKKNIPINIDCKYNVFYDLIILDSLNINELNFIGGLHRINSLYINLTEEGDVTLDYLLNDLTSLKKLYLTFNYFSETSQSLYWCENETLEELTLKHCNIKCNILTMNLVKSLKKLVLIDCYIDFKFINVLNNTTLVELHIINCKIDYTRFIKLPSTLRKITFDNKNTDDIKDLVFLSYRSLSDNLDGLCSFKTNNKTIMLKFSKNQDLLLGRITDILDTSSIKLPYVSKLNIAVYLNSKSLNFDFLNKFEHTNLQIELYSYTYKFYDPIGLIGPQNLDIYHYNIALLNSYLRNIKDSEDLSVNDIDFLRYYTNLNSNRTTKVNPSSTKIKLNGNIQHLSKKENMKNFSNLHKSSTLISKSLEFGKKTTKTKYKKKIEAMSNNLRNMKGSTINVYSGN